MKSSEELLDALMVLNQGVMDLEKELRGQRFRLIGEVLLIAGVALENAIKLERFLVREAEVMMEMMKG
jgi:hypothetical protein